jgi:hypothetical protein
VSADTNLKVIELHITESSIPVMVTEDENALESPHAAWLQRLRLLIKQRSCGVKHCLLGIVEDLGHLQVMNCYYRKHTGTNTLPIDL